MIIEKIKDFMKIPLFFKDITLKVFPTSVLSEKHIIT